MRCLHTVLLMGALGCTSSVEPPKPSTPSTTERATPPATKAADPTTPSDPPQWACKTDRDCTQTCALGAVSTAWITAHPEADSCDDGCGWKHGKQACKDGECVTLTDSGDIDASCTKLRQPSQG